MLKVSFFIRSFIFISTLLFILFGAVHICRSQTKFNENPGGFIQEMSEWLENEAGRDRNFRNAASELMETYQLEWDIAFTFEQQMMVIKTCNVMISRRVRPNPHFMQYLKLVLMMAKSDQSLQSFSEWNSSLNHILNRRTRHFPAFMDFTDALINKNYIYKSNIHRWRITSNDYYFLFEDGQINIVFPETDMICYAFNDSSVIYNTLGVYDPVTNRWKGKGGKVTWERVGFGSEEVFAELNNYELRTQFSRYSADSVLFHNQRLFSEPQLGKLSENVQQFRDTISASYPRFQSYSKRYVIENVFRNVHYEGGYAYQGARFMGTGDLNNPASFSYVFKGKEAVRVTSPSFTIRTDRVSSSMAQVVIYLDEDSIYHPGLEVVFNDNDRILSMYTVEVGTGQSRFFNTYHGIDMACEELHWDMEKGELRLQTAAGVSGASQAYFESRDYFSRHRFDRLRGMDVQNPLFSIRQYSQRVGRKNITLDEYAHYLRKDPVQVMMQLITVANQGYIDYDVDRGEFYVLDKVANALMSFAGLIDYDVIQFYSATVAGTPNAVIDMNSLDMDIYGLGEAIQLSDSQNVFILPDRGHITMQKNRSFLFSGFMRIGLFRFQVEDAHFDYMNFSIDAPDIRSLTFYVNSFDPNDLDARGYRRQYRVQTELTDLSGKIAIDNPQNKSGVKNYPRYPIFTCTSDAYAYYDSKDIHNGTYERDRFYYRIYPFEIDSLANFSTEGFKLYGTMVSADIFPEISPPLIVRPDYSLGFVYNTGDAGIPAYGGIGNFYKTIDLSNEGFYGIGELEYITSKGVSENYLFTPDSTVAELRTYNVEEFSEEVEFPQLFAEDVKMRWFPYDDIMKINHKDRHRRLKEKPIEMYDQRALLHGNFVLTSSGSTGNGALAIRDAEMDSKKFEFGSRTIDSDHVDFRLKATFTDIEVGIIPREGYELMTYDYSAHIDFNKEVGIFTSNSGASNVEFLINQYIASIDMFEWHMNAEFINMKNTSAIGVEIPDNLTMEELVDMEMIGSEFISTNPFQDSLSFFAIDAMYDRKKNIINASGVKYIKVADAAIFPDKERVTIFRRAEMDTLYNAGLLTNIHTKFHRFYDVTAFIRGRKQYEAKGNYKYVDMLNDQQKISFHRIYSDRSAHSNGEGKIVEEDGFSLSPYFGFYGKVFMRSASPNLTFNGGASIRHACDTKKREWINFSSEIDPTEVMIPIDERTVNMNYSEIFFGIMVSRDTTDVYGAFAERKGRATDKEIIYASGFLMFDEMTSEYRVSGIKKLEDIDESGNYLSLNTEECIIYGEGKLAIGEDLGLVKMETLGNATYDIAQDSLILDMVMSIDFFFSDQALRVFSRDMERSGGLGVSLNTDAYLYALNHWVGYSKADELFDEISLYGAVRRIPQEMAKTIVFADINLAYNNRTRSFIYQGPIGIGNIKERQINSYVDGKIEISRERSGDVFTILLEIDEENWYLFDYSRGRMMALSSNNDFNTAIRETKANRRRIQDEETREMYQYTLSTARKKRSFERMFARLEQE